MKHTISWLTKDQYAIMPTWERALNWAGHFASANVREWGWNRGPWVERFLESVGLPGGYAWCAAFVYHNLRKAGMKRESLPRRWKAAAVRYWVEWADQNDLMVEYPKRGDYGFWLNENGTGHIFVIRNSDEWLKNIHMISTIEGNTNSGGSREGDGVYRRERHREHLEKRYRFGFFRVDGV